MQRLASGLGILPCLLVLSLPVAAAPQAVVLPLGEPGAALPPGVATIGKVGTTAGPAGGALRFAEGAHLRLPSSSWFNPDAGSIAFHVQAAWPADDTARRCFVHLGSGDAHVTVFRHGGTQVIFVYKGNPTSWRGATLRTGPWEPGSWHTITANWTQSAADGIVLCLGVDGEHVSATGAVPLTAVPEETFIGSRGAGIEPADTAFAAVHLRPDFAPSELAAPEHLRIDVRIAAERPAGAAPRVSSFVTPWNSPTNPIPFTPGHPYFRRFQEAGFDLVRLVAFSEHWLWGTRVERDAEGRLVLDFSDFDTLLDLYRGAGAEPYVRLAYHVPSALARPEAGHAKAYAAPRDLDEWTAFMGRIVAHCNRDRQLGIRYWVTMLNEADIPIHRGETDWDTVYDLYERTTRAVKAVDPTAKVGGPATCGPLPGRQAEDIRAFLRFCRSRDLPPDFLCFHAYKRPRPSDYEKAVLAVRQVVAEEWPGLEPEYFLDEWNLWSNDSRQSSEYAAAYLTAGVHFQTRAGLTRSAIVSFNSHLSAAELSQTGFVRQGPFRKDDAPVATARFYAAEATIGEAAPRRVLYTHAVPGRGPLVPYTFGRYRVALPQAACEFRTGTALAIAHDRADGCGMAVILRSEGAEHRLVTTHVRDMAWQEHRIDLAPFAGKTIEIEFRTDCGRDGNVQADHGLWGTPAIVAGDRIVTDFCALVADAETGYVLAPGEWYERQPTLPLIKGNIVTPAYFAYVLMNRLRGESLPVELDGTGGIHRSEAVGAMACRDGETVRVLAWHFDPRRAEFAHVLDTPAAAGERQIDLHLTGLGRERWRYTQYLIDREHSNAYTDYVRRGGDTRDGAYNLESGSLACPDQRTLETANGSLELTVTLRNLAVTLLEFTPE